MNTIRRWHFGHAQHLRVAWLAVLLLLSACNNSDGGGGNGY